MIAEAFSPSQNYGSHFILRRSSKDVIDQTSKDNSNKNHQSLIFEEHAYNCNSKLKPQ